MIIQTFGFQSKPKPPLGVFPQALFDYSESETSLLNPTGLLQTSPIVNANPTVRTDSNLELVWPNWFQIHVSSNTFTS